MTVESAPSFGPIQIESQTPVPSNGAIAHGGETVTPFAAASHF